MATPAKKPSKRAAKSAGKSAAKSAAASSSADVPASIPQPHGGALLAGGMPGNKGGGRPPNEFKEWMRKLVSRKEVDDQLEKVTANADHEHWMSAIRHATEHGYGKPAQSLEFGGKVEVVIKFED